MTKTETTAEQEIEADRDSTSSPSLPAAAYAGTYTDAWYGDITITQEDECTGDQVLDSLIYL